MIATILAVLWCVDSAAALKCNGYGLESSAAGHLDKDGVHWRWEPGMQMYGMVYTRRECSV